MHYFTYVLYEPESTNYEPYYLTWFDSSYSKAGPYGESLQYQEELLNESNSSQYKEAKVGYLSESWYSYDQGCDTIELPYNSSSSWLDEYEYYFAGCWGEDMARHGYNDSFYEPYNGSLEKAGNADINGDQSGSNHSFNEDLQHAYSDSQWPGFDFGFADGINETYLDHGWKETQPSYDDCWSETRLYESIFGHWPCLVEQDPESHAASSH